MATRTVLREILNAIERDDSNTVLSLINANSGATFQTDDGLSLLHYACLQGATKCVHQLISSGNDVNTKNKKGVTPIQLATEKGHSKIIKLLVTAGATVTQQDIESILTVQAESIKYNVQVSKLVEVMLDFDKELTDAIRKCDIKQLLVCLSEGSSWKNALVYISSEELRDFFSKCTTLPLDILTAQNHAIWISLINIADMDKLIQSIIITYPDLINAKDDSNRMVLQLALPEYRKLLSNSEVNSAKSMLIDESFAQELFQKEDQLRQKEFQLIDAEAKIEELKGNLAQALKQAENPIWYKITCPGFKIAIRGKPNSTDTINGYITNNQVISVHRKIDYGYYELANGSGFISLSGSKILCEPVEDPSLAEVILSLKATGNTPALTKLNPLYESLGPRRMSESLLKRKGTMASDSRTTLPNSSNASNTLNPVRMTIKFQCKELLLGNVFDHVKGKSCIHLKGFTSKLAISQEVKDSLSNLLSTTNVLVWDGDNYNADSFTQVIPLLLEDRADSLDLLSFKYETGIQDFFSNWNRSVQIFSNGEVGTSPDSPSNNASSGGNSPSDIPLKTVTINCVAVPTWVSTDPTTKYLSLGVAAMQATDASTVVCLGGGHATDLEYKYNRELCAINVNKTSYWHIYPLTSARQGNQNCFFDDLPKNLQQSYGKFKVTVHT